MFSKLNDKLGKFIDLLIKDAPLRLLSFFPILNTLSVIYIGIKYNSGFDLVSGFMYLIIAVSGQSFAIYTWPICAIHYSISYKREKKKLLSKDYDKCTKCQYKNMYDNSNVQDINKSDEKKEYKTNDDFIFQYANGNINKKNTDIKNEEEKIDIPIYEEVIVGESNIKISKEDNKSKDSDKKEKVESQSDIPQYNEVIVDSFTKRTYEEVRNNKESERKEKEEFLNDMKKYIYEEGFYAAHVPFNEKYPTYSKMDTRQKKWYFYWRTEVRKENYLNTDLSYLLLYIYELINDEEYNNEKVNYQKLLKLFNNYRIQYEELDTFMVDWIFDYTKAHGLGFNLDYLNDIKKLPSSIVVDLYIDNKVDDKRLSLSLPFISAISDYNIMEGEFYNSHHKYLIELIVPEVLSLVDSSLRIEKGGCLLDLYTSKEVKETERKLFEDALYFGDIKKTSILYTDYINSSKLRKFVGSIVSYTESLIMEIGGYPMKNKSHKIDESLKIEIKDYINDKYGEYKVKENKENINREDISIDINNDKSNLKDDKYKLIFKECKNIINNNIEVNNNIQKENINLSYVKNVELVEDSETIINNTKEKNKIIHKNKEDKSYLNSIEDDLAFKNRENIINEIKEDDIIYSNKSDKSYLNSIEDDLRFAENKNTLSSKVENVSIEEDINLVDIFDHNKLNSELKKFVSALSDEKLSAINILLHDNDQEVKLNYLCEKNATMLDLLIEEINDIALETFDDIVIEFDNDKPLVLEEYKNVLLAASRGS